MPTFLELLTTTVLQINNDDLLTLIESVAYGSAPTPRDSMITGNMPKSEYIAIAQNVKNFMDTQGKAPEYAYNTSLGLFFGYHNMIYTYSKILDEFNSTGVLPASIKVKAWSVVSNPNIASFTPAQIVNAATWVKNYIETNHQLPTTVTINEKTVPMTTFLELLTTTVLQINDNDLTTLIDSLTYASPPTPRDSMITGNMPKSEYIAIAQNVQNFMARQSKAPEYAYSTSLGMYFGYQNMIYTYSKILETYNTTETLTDTAQVRSWRYISDPNAATFSPTQITNAATQVKNYIETNHLLPATVEINGINIGMPTFLELLTTTVLQINNNDLITLIDSVSYGNAPTPRDTITPGYMPKSEYIAIAQNVKNFMDTQGKAPEYAYNTSLGLFFGYQNMIYTYSKILDEYNSTGVFPASIKVKAWSVVSNPNIASFKPAQIVNAATWVKNYIETNHQLPTTVTINEKPVPMTTFLELLTTTVLQINENDLTTLIDSLTYGSAPNPRDSMSTGNLQQSEYISIAQNVKNFMDRQNKAPEYAYNTSLGMYFGYQNLIYTYSKILDTYNTTGALPDDVLVTGWKIVSDPNGGTFTLTEIVDAAVWVKNYIDINNQLPETVHIGIHNIIMPTFLELLTTALLKINNNDLTSLIDSVTYGSAPNPRDTMTTGDMPHSEYVAIAQNVKNFMDTQGKAPEYAYSTSLGLYFSYPNMIYAYSKILNVYNTTGLLPGSVAVGPWMVSVGHVATTAGQLKNYVDTYHQLPSSVTVNGITISLPTFLELLTTSVIQINNDDLNTLINPIIYGNAPQPRDEMSKGEIPQIEYISIAQNVKNFMDTQGKAPEYAYGTSLGLFFSYQNLIYTYSTIMNHYKQNNVLPDVVTVQPWYVVIKTFKIDIIIGGTGGYVLSNNLINAYIPSTTASYDVVNAATQGTPMLTFGDGNGPKVMIVAGVHGNEIPATVAAMHLINYLNGKTIHGTIYVIPFAIPYSSSITSRYWQGQNPNSVANIPGTPTNNILNTAIYLNVDALGDFHSTQPGGVPGQNAAMYSKSPTYESYVIASYISSYTGSALIGAYQAGVDYPGALEDVCNLAGVPAVTCEVRSAHGTIASGSITASFNQMLGFLSYHNLT